VINNSYDYEASKHMSKLSAPSQGSSGRLSSLGAPVSAKPGSAVARPAFNSRVLKPLHLNAVLKDKEEANNNNNNNNNNKEEEKKKAGEKEKREEKAVLEPNSGEKDRVQKAYGYHHEDQYHGRHHPHGQNAQPQQQVHRVTEDVLSLNKTSIASGASGSSSSDESALTRSPKEFSRGKIFKPAASTMGHWVKGLQRN